MQQELFDPKKDHFVVRWQQVHFPLPHGLRPILTIVGLISHLASPYRGYELALAQLLILRTHKQSIFVLIQGNSIQVSAFIN